MEDRERVRLVLRNVCVVESSAEHIRRWESIKATKSMYKTSQVQEGKREQEKVHVLRMFETLVLGAETTR